MGELISVIIPLYNRLDAFKKALDSVLIQTYKNIEVIVVDDGSVPIISNDKFQISNDNRVIFIHQENKGAPSARNAGLEIAKGEYVIFWDADVVGKPEMLQKMYDALQKNRETNFAYCNHGLHVSCNIYHITKKLPGRDFDFVVLKKINYIHATSLIRRVDVVKWDESLKRFQDWDLWLTMSGQGKKGVWVDEYLFEIISLGTMSSWLPAFAYKKPWKYLPWFKEKVERYEQAREIVLKKHNL